MIFAHFTVFTHLSVKPAFDPPLNVREDEGAFHVFVVEILTIRLIKVTGVLNLGVLVLVAVH